MLGVLVALPGIARDFTYEYEGQTLTYTVIDEDAKTCKTKDGHTYYDSYWNLLIERGNNATGALVIPSVAKDGDSEYTVTEIGEYAFYSCSTLTSVTIPNSVNEISSLAFNVCSDLKTFTIEDGQSLIAFESGVLSGAPIEHLYIGRNWSYSGSGAISNDIKSVEIGNSVTKLPFGAFYNCSRLTSVTIPNSVTSIGGKAFYGCSSLTSISIGNSVNEIGDQAFNGCSGLTSVTIPNSVTSIGYSAFFECPGLTSVTIGNSVNEIGDQAFNGCSGLTTVTIPNSVTSIGKYAFAGCFGLKTFTIEDGQNLIAFESGVLYALSIEHLYIGRNWSYSDSGAISNDIKSVEIGNSVTKLPFGAFYNCSRLTSVTIPNSVTSIGRSAFDGCSGLKKSAYPSGLNDPFSYGVRIQYPREGAIIEDGFVFGPEKNAIYFAPFSLEGEYVIPESVSSIGAKAFSRCSGLTSVIIPNAVTSIGRSAFEGCSGLTSISIGNVVTSIGEYAFYDCSGLTSVIIPNAVTSIGEYAFYGCSGLTSVIIPKSVNSIGDYAFDGCSGLKKSAYPSGLYNPFSYGVWIQYPREGAIIEDGFVFGPEKNAIYFAPFSLEGEYVIPESVSSIGAKAFSRCSGLTSVKATAINPPVMNDNSFEDLYATAALSVPVEATTDYLATNWSLFKNLRMGDSETGCQTYETGNLKYMLLPGKTKDDQNFAVVIQGDYSSLTEVTIPERFSVSDNGTNVRYYVDGIGFKAFKGCSNLATVTFNSRNASRLIGDYAFAGTKISALTIPETVESIGNHAFDGCESLTSIAIPGSVKVIGNHAFDGCESLTSIAIPGSVGTIGDYAFNGCTAMTNAKLEAGVKTIGDYAFYNTPLNEVTLNKGLETIGEKCFSASRDRNIEPVYIPSTLTSVGEDAFMNFNCRYVNISDLTAWCNIDFGNENSNPAAHMQGLYLNGEKIENLVIPESVDAIKDYTFCYNSTLKSVKFNDALQNIGTMAFYNCSGLTTAVIPGNVTAIGSSAFNSTNVKDLTLAYGAEQIKFGNNAFPAPTTLSWDRPIESLNLGISSLESLTIGNSVTEIPAAKFKGASKLTSLTLGNSLTAIGDEAFSGCTALTEVILPPSVETIGASAFAGNNKLTSIIMGHNVATIGEKAYDLCPAQTVSITAQTPPTAPDNTFSNYTGNLYVQGEDAVKAYYNSDFCWFQFEGHVMIEPTDLKVEGDKTLTGKPGDTFQLTARLYPEDVTLPQIFWRSTNPDIATVDANGLVTLHADLSEIMTMAEGDDSSANSCRIIAESLYADGPVAEVTVNNNQSGVDTIFDNNDPKEIDFTAPVEVYNLQGVKVATTVDHLSAGIYIVRQGKNVMKMAVK